MSEPTNVGLNALERHSAEKVNEERIKQLKSMPTYVVKSAKQVLEANPTPPTEIWGGIYLNNDINEIIGASGVGKSRIMLDLAVRQCLADTVKEERDASGAVIAPEFAGLPLYRGEVKWLLIGTENSINRYHHDLVKMTKFCTPEQIETLGKRLFMTTLEGEGDTYIALDAEEGEDNENFQKLQALIAQVNPNVVVFDPWGDVIAGSELDDRVVRDTVMLIRKLKRGIRDQLTIIIINHARMGAGENAKATGLDAANFGKNSKALYTIARCVWNLPHLADDIASPIVGMVNAKRSNEQPYAPRAVCLDPEYMTYKTRPDIDVNECLRDLRATANKPEQNKAETRAKEYESSKDKAVKAIEAELKEGRRSKAYLENIAKTSGASVRDINGILAILVEKQGYKSMIDPRDKKTYYGTENAIAELSDEIEKMKLAKKAEKEAKKPKKRGRPRKNKSPEK